MQHSRLDPCKSCPNLYAPSVAKRHFINASSADTKPATHSNALLDHVIRIRLELHLKLRPLTLILRNCFVHPLGIQLR